MYIQNQQYQPSTAPQEMNDKERRPAYFRLKREREPEIELGSNEIPPSSDSLRGLRPINKLQDYEMQFEKLKRLERECVEYSAKAAERKINSDRLKLERKIEAARQLLENEAQVRAQAEERYNKIKEGQEQRRDIVECQIEIKAAQFNMIKLQDVANLKRRMCDFFELYFREKRLNQYSRPSKAEQAFIIRHYFQNHEQVQEISRASRVPIHMVTLLIKAEQRKRTRNQRLAQ